MFDYLVSKVHETVGQMADHRKTDRGYDLSDVVMSAFAMFSLKDPSLLAFKNNYEVWRENLEQVFKIKGVSSDNGLRKILDRADPIGLLPCFEALYREPEVEEAVKGRLCFAALGGFVAIAADGTEHFCSNHTNCPHYLVRKLKNGEVQYYHQMVGACIVKPNEKTVLPVFAEPITRHRTGPPRTIASTMRSNAWCRT